jgi:hypothetical protein
MIPSSARGQVGSRVTQMAEPPSGGLSTLDGTTSTLDGKVMVVASLRVSQPLDPFEVARPLSGRLPEAVTRRLDEVNIWG